MIIGDLSDLAYVLEQVRNVLNTASSNRYPKDKMNELKRRMARLEEEFINGVLDFDMDSFLEEEDEEEDLQATIAAAKAAKAAREAAVKAGPVAVKRANGSVVVEAPDALSKDEASMIIPQEEAVALAKKAPRKNAKTSASEDDEQAEFKRKLAEAKKKLAEGKKKG